MTNEGQQATATMTTPSDREIHVERVFDAPRDRVWEVFTDPKMIPQWWGSTTVVDHMDVKPGGSWRFVGHNPDGSEIAFRGTFREVTPPERLVQTFETEGMGGPHVQTFVFEDLGDRTKLTTTLVFDTSEQRDGVLQYGGEVGMNETYARVDKLLTTLASG